MAWSQRDIHTALVQKTAPATEPVTTTDAKAHENVTSSDDDATIALMIAAARAKCENFLGRQLISATYTFYLDAFPAEILLPKPPSTAVTHVKYTDTNGDEQTLDVDDDYQIDLSSEPARIRPADGQSWPSTKTVYNAVEVEYVTGYANAAAVPKDYILGLKHLFGSWYRNREDWITGMTSTEIGGMAEVLLAPTAVIPI